MSEYEFSNPAYPAWAEKRIAELEVQNANMQENLLDLEAERDEWKTKNSAAVGLLNKLGERCKELEEEQAWRITLQDELVEIREAAQNVLEDAEQGAIGKDDLCLTQLAALAGERSYE